MYVGVEQTERGGGEGGRGISAQNWGNCSCHLFGAAYVVSFVSLAAGPHRLTPAFELFSYLKSLVEEDLR